MHCGFWVGFISDSIVCSKKHILLDLLEKNKIDCQRKNGFVKARTEWANNFPSLKYSNIGITSARKQLSIIKGLFSSSPV